MCCHFNASHSSAYVVLLFLKSFYFKGCQLSLQYHILMLSLSLEYMSLQSKRNAENLCAGTFVDVILFQEVKLHLLSLFLEQQMPDICVTINPTAQIINESFSRHCILLVLGKDSVGT